MPETRFAQYPDAKIVDDAGIEIQHLLWGDWVEVQDDPPVGGLLRVRSRGVDGFMDPNDLQEQRVVEIVFVDVGQGDGALLVTDDDRHVIVDAGLGDNMYRFLRWRYAGFQRPWTFDAAVISHPDSDHYAGFGDLFNEPTVSFGAVYINGILEQRGDDPLGPQFQDDDDQWYLSELLHDQAAVEAFLAESERWQGHPTQQNRWKQYPKLLNTLVTEDRVGAIAMLATEAQGPRTFVPGFTDPAGVRLEVLGPLLEHPDPADDTRAMLRQYGPVIGSMGRNKGKTKNGNSIILKLIHGNVSVLLGGDLNQPSEHFLLHAHAGLDPAHDDADFPYDPAHRAALVDANRVRFGVDVAKVCHHGAADLTNEMLLAQHPAAFVVSSGDNESHAHPRPETLGALGRHGRGDRPLLFSTELMRSTREHNDDHRSQHDTLHQAIRDAEEAEDHQLVDELEEQLHELEDRIFGRNVATYGAINVRTDGTDVVIAYKLERERVSNGRLTKWDLYRFEPDPADNDTLAVVDGDGH